MLELNKKQLSFEKIKSPSGMTEFNKGFNPVGKIAKKQSACVFVNSAFKIQCLVVKNTLL